MAKIPEDAGMGRLGLVEAIVAARQALTDGAAKAQLWALRSRIQG